MAGDQFQQAVHGLVHSRAVYGDHGGLQVGRLSPQRDLGDSALVTDWAIRGQPYGCRAFVVLLVFGMVFGLTVVVAESVIKIGAAGR
ncbi:hypothetical protein [Kitasatospora sp. NPDC059803]|uniref:hypothetical protein n=1 Tax=Kitasatospora sp. NPDC059803 TaxID=3346953 RepID=UPI0036552655